MIDANQRIASISDDQISIQISFDEHIHPVNFVNSRSGEAWVPRPPLPKWGTGRHRSRKRDCFDSSGAILRTSATVGNFEELSLAGLTAGDYYFEVLGNLGDVNRAYGITLRAPL